MKPYLIALSLAIALNQLRLIIKGNRTADITLLAIAVIALAILSLS